MKIFRDPIHDVIDLDTGDKAVNDLIIKLIDSKEFQRLHFIKQLGLTYLAYPCATHSRFEHSLGVAYLAKIFLNKIISLEEKILSLNESSPHRGKFIDFFEQIKKHKPLTIVAALLHDIGHGALSHVTEDIIGIKHEEWVKKIIFENTVIHELLVKYDQNSPQIIFDILSTSNASFYSGKIISGQLDIDKMDYLLRDSHMTGSGYGRFDMGWLLNVLTVGIVEENVEIGLDLGKSLSVAEDFVMARINMFRNVYLHKTTLVAQNMFRLLFERFGDLKKEDINKYFINESLQKVFFADKKNASLLLDDYLSVSDIDLYYFLKTLQTSEDEVLRELSTGLLNRHLFKLVPPEHLHGIRTFIREKKGEKAEKYYIVELEIVAKEERLTYRAGEDCIYLFDKDGKASELLEKSLIMPLNMNNYTLRLGHYVDSEVYNQFLSKMKEQACKKYAGKKLDINIDNISERELMIRSIEEAAKSKPEDNEKIHPKVGAVLCDFNGDILLTAFRGKAAPGAHCEFSLLKEVEEQKIDCSNTVLFVTLEPCTIRGTNKVPCAQRIANAGIPKVYIGAIDPNEKFRSIGETFLRDNGIEVERYPHDLVMLIRAMNKDFENQFVASSPL